MTVNVFDVKLEVCKVCGMECLCKVEHEGVCLVCNHNKETYGVPEEEEGE